MIDLPFLKKPIHNSYIIDKTGSEVLELRKQFNQGGISLDPNHQPPLVCHRDCYTKPSLN